MMELLKFRGKQILLMIDWGLICRRENLEKICWRALSHFSSMEFVGVFRSPL